jgi:hypothetical protein
MLKRALLLSFSLSLLAFTGIGCAAPTEPTGEDTASDESELRGTKFTRLDQATPEQVADTFKATFDAQLDECLAAHPSIRSITKTNISTLTSIGNLHYIDLGEALRTMLDDKGQGSARPSTLKGYARNWALAKLAPHVKNGKVAFEGIEPLAIYEAVRSTEEALSIANAEKARGVDLAALRAQWREVESENNLDSDFLRPVKVDREPSLTEIKKHFGYSRLSMQSFAWDAVDDFAAADEGPNGSAKFKPIQTSLEHSYGIKKRWYLTGGGADWSRNVLIVMDEKNQLWGFMMGYSE